MQLFLEAVPTILKLFSKARGHLLFSNIIIPGIICQSLVADGNIIDISYFSGEKISYPPTILLLEGQPQFFGQKFASVPLFTAFLGTNLSLDLMIFSFFYQLCKNVLLLDQKVPLSQEFCPTFCFRQVGKYEILNRAIF